MHVYVICLVEFCLWCPRKRDRSNLCQYFINLPTWIIIIHCSFWLPYIQAHVRDIVWSEESGFMKTIPSPFGPSDKIYALDCEMVSLFYVLYRGLLNATGACACVPCKHPRGLIQAQIHKTNTAKTNENLLDLAESITFLTKIFYRIRFPFCMEAK